MTTVKIQLDREREIVFDNLSRYRLGVAPHPADFADLRDRRRSFSALCTWVWACLTEEHQRDFASPADVARHIGIANQSAASAALIRAIEAASETEKNADGSTPKPSSTSS